MKVIFLDVDGVLNSEDELILNYGNVDARMEIFDSHLQLLKELIDITGAKIVVSSTWRKGHYKFSRSKYSKELYEALEERLADFDMTIIDVTPILQNPFAKRGDEIREWLKTTKYKIESFVIFDDEDDMCEYTNTNLVKTSMSTGLQKEHIEKAMTILNKESSIQKDIIEILKKKWSEYPELRFGQLIVNALGVDPFYMNDKEAMQRLQKINYERYTT